MGRTIIISSLAVLLFLICCCGCSNDQLDPTDVGRFRPVPVVNVILDSLGVVDEPAEAFANAEDPLPSDVIYATKDYTFSPGDLIRISIFELQQMGQLMIDNYVVTETGRISIPDVGIVHAGGLTESELEGEIRDFLSPDILTNPSVNVILVRSERLVFSISGDGVRRASRYDIPRGYDFRLLDALALAGGVEQFNVSNVYITRQVRGTERELGEFRVMEPAEAAMSPVEQFPEFLIPDIDEMELFPIEPYHSSPEEEILEVIAPYHTKHLPNRDLVITSSELATADELMNVAAPDGFSFKPVSTKTAADELPVSEIDTDSDETQIEWVYENGKWTPVVVGGKAVSEPALEIIAHDRIAPVQKPEAVGSYGWDEIGRGGQESRVIKIPKNDLYGGDERYNIVIEPGDVITVPVDIVGEFYVDGHTNVKGAINITGRPITLKQAIAAAGGLGALAWPQKVEVVRRIGRNKEVIVLVDLKKIANGTQPDFFIKPNDLIRVGTHGISRFLFRLRDAFNPYYGFTFNYSRNFANPQNYGYANLDPVGHAQDLF